MNNYDLCNICKQSKPPLSIFNLTKEDIEMIVTDENIKYLIFDILFYNEKIKICNQCYNIIHANKKDSLYDYYNTIHILRSNILKIKNGTNKIIQHNKIVTIL